MTDDTLREECEKLIYKLSLDKTSMPDDVDTLMAFARAQQVKGLREAAEILLTDPDNVCDWTDGAWDLAADMSNYLKDQATALENKKGVEPKPYPLKDE